MRPLARFAMRRSRAILTVLLVILIAAALSVSSLSNRLQPYAPAAPGGSNSAAAASLIEHATRIDPNGGLIALIALPHGQRPSEAGTLVRRVVHTLLTDPVVGGIIPPATQPGIAAVSRDQHELYIAAGYRPNVSAHAQQTDADRLARRLRLPGVTLGGTGPGFSEGSKVIAADFRRAELISFPILVLLAFWFFRGAAAALLCAAFGGLGIAASLITLRIATTITPVSIFALNLVTALGVGLAFDYSLLLINRYREELATGKSPEQALGATMATAGRTIAVSAVTVATALAALLVLPDPSLASMGIAGAAVALASAGLALFGLPAALSLLERRVDSLAPAALQRRVGQEAQPLTSGRWYRLARFVTRRPARFALASAAILLAAGAPVKALHLTQGGPELIPANQAAHKVSDAIQRNFSPQFQATPIQVVVASGVTPRLRAFAGSIAALPNVAAVSPPQPLNRHSTRIAVISRSGPFTPASQQLVNDIRGLQAPARSAVGGETAVLIDTDRSVLSRVPLALALAIAAALVLVFYLTGSILIPIKTVLLNLISVAATLGLLTLTFQSSALGDLLGFSRQEGFMVVIPLFIAALGFGMATDYGVLLLARIKEGREEGLSNDEAIALGMERTGRIVTAAAVLFAVAVGGTLSGEMIVSKEAGFGMVVVALIDAMLVRTFLVPSLMTLLGELNWWAPKPLRGWHDRISPSRRSNKASVFPSS